MNKKIFASLVLGFGATLATLVAISMPPGSWAVVLGVMLGLAACIPVLIVAIFALSHRQRRPEPQAPVQPIILVQSPVMPGYALPQNGYDQPVYYVPEGYEYQQYPALQQGQPPRRRREQERVMRKQLPSKRRTNQAYAYYVDEYPDDANYYAEPYAQEVPEQPQRYDAYYGTQPEYNWETEEQEYERRPKNNRRNKRTNYDMTIDADFRTIGE